MTMQQRIGLGLLLLALGAGARAADPAGDWRTIDDESGEARSIVRLTVTDGTLSGTVVKIFNPTEPNPRCDACSGERNGQPVEGMTILWGLEPDDDEWVGGTVLDPESGSEYQAQVKVIDNGRRLELRGYVGVPWLGRTQVWERIEG